jgi:hypothetical protein
VNSVSAGITHFQALAFFALTVSVTFAFLTKREAIERAKYVAWAFLAFLIVAVGIGWVMYPFSR